MIYDYDDLSSDSPDYKNEVSRKRFLYRKRFLRLYTKSLRI